MRLHNRSIDGWIQIKATHMKLRSERKSDSSRILKDMTENSPTRAKRYRKLITKVSPQSQTLTAEQANAMMCSAQLTKRQYQIIKQFVGKVLPNYNELLEAKKMLSTFEH